MSSWSASSRRMGVRLEGALRLPASSTASTLPVDVMIFHHGVGGNFYNQSFFEPMSAAILKRGCAVMRGGLAAAIVGSEVAGRAP